jgi:hypothetical protein
MKAIIKGFRYDTDKADLVCEIQESYRGNFRHIDAGLFCTKRAKRFFLAGSGGPMTIFATQVDQNTWSGGSKIIPLSKESALEWAEQHATVEQIERFFEIEDA